MKTDSKRLSLIGSIYESVGEDGADRHVMASLAAHLGAAGAFWYIIHKGASGRTVGTPYLFDGSFGFSTKALQEFRDEWWRHDYSLRAALVTDRTTETHELISEAELARSDYAHWILNAAGVDRRIGRSTELPGDVVAGWALHMPPGVKREERERTEFDLLAPHVRNFFRLTSQMSDISTERNALEAIINAQAHPVILLGGHGTILWASEAALRLLARDDGIGCRDNRLTFARSKEKQLFETLRERAATTEGLTAWNDVGRLPVARPSGAFPYILELVPAPASFQRQMHSKGAFIVTIHDADSDADPQPERWRDMFGLTPMETRVAMLTMRGLPDVAIASQLGVGIGTIRSHQKQILVKTETKSKAEAAHLLTRLS